MGLGGLMGRGPDGLGPPGLLNKLASLGPDAPVLFRTLLDQGLSPGQALHHLSQSLDTSQPPAYSQSPGYSHGGPGQVEPAAVAQVFDSLPPDVQQAIVRGADQLPQPVRDALDQLGITQPQVPAHGRGEGAEQARQAWGPENAYNRSGNEQVLGNAREAFANVRAEAAQLASQPPGLARAQTADAVLMPGNAAVVREGSQQAPLAGQQAALASQAERANAQTLPNNALPAGARGAESNAGVARDPGGTVVAMPDRMAAMQQATQAPNAPLPQARPDALPMQAMASLAGATVLANPQAAQALPGHTALNAPAPPGTDMAAAQARDATQLAPAGHTIGGFLRRDLRRGPQPNDRRTENWALALLTGARKRRANDAEEQMASFQWLFWILTIVAYGSLAAAVVIMVPNRGQLFTAEGAPTLGVYALGIGGIAALVSWWLGRKLANR